MLGPLGILSREVTAEVRGDELTMEAKRRRKAQNVNMRTHLEEEEKHINQEWSELIDQGFASYSQHTKPSTKPVLVNKVNWSITIAR